MQKGSSTALLAQGLFGLRTVGSLANGSTGVCAFWPLTAPPHRPITMATLIPSCSRKWFSDICPTLLLVYGSCRIPMDDAAYHKRVLNRSQTHNWNKAEIQHWHIERGLLNEATATKLQLLDLSHRNKLKPMYSADGIAT
ncbi:hypothetical protein PybrP1_002371 [[Pythium] brassicae (nom. inval.)]|nr:hypothetical protein PybrP1_002371 [[Pythium] brassicae (nom. inval.)]